MFPDVSWMVTAVDSLAVLNSSMGCRELGSALGDGDEPRFDELTPMVAMGMIGTADWDVFL